ncbi:MAG: IS607 family transposase [Planctomycetaceae bacterium]|nr:IS607 family transposase [Planctomycetaceae bacterium]
MATATLSSRSQCAHGPLLSVGQAANLLGVSTQTIRNHLERGELEGFVMASGHRRLSRKAVLEAAGESTGEDTEDKSKVIIYCRVSSAGQNNTKKTGESDLTRQVARMKLEAKKRYPDRELVLIQDCASSMNWERQGLKKLIMGMVTGEFREAVLLVENRDRLNRMCLGLIELLAEYANVSIVYTNQENSTDEELLVADLLAVTHLFSVKMLSRRSATRRKKQLSPEFIERATILINEGMSMRDVANQLEREGFRDGQGNVVSYSVIRIQIAKPLDKLKKVLPNSETPAMRFLRENTEQAPRHYRLPIDALYAEYVKWSEKHHAAPVSCKRLLANLNNEKAHGEIKGLVVKGKRLHVVRQQRKEHVRTETLNERLRAFCEMEGLSYNQAQKKLMV